MNKNPIKETLAKRAVLSMQGKAIIGLLGGTILVLVSLIKNCNSCDIDLESDNIRWLNYNVIGLATTLDSNKWHEYYSRYGIPNSKIDSTVRYIRNKVKGGAIVSELNQMQLDSILYRHKIKKTDSILNIPMYFYVNCFNNTSDFVIILHDSLISQISDLPHTFTPDTGGNK